MPLYEYECDACRQRFEKIQKFSDPPLETCAKCGKGPVRKLLSSPAIQFKGSGWYITDYANKGKGDAAAAGKTGPTSESGAGAKTEGGKTESATPSGSSTATTPGGTSSPAPTNNKE